MFLTAAVFLLSTPLACASPIPAGPVGDEENVNSAIVEIRDRLFLTCSVGKVLNDFYYRYTLYSARSVDADRTGLLRSFISLSLVPIVQVLRHSSYLCIAVFLWLGFIAIGPVKRLFGLKARWTLLGFLCIGTFFATLLVTVKFSPSEREKTRCIREIRSSNVADVPLRDYLDHPDPNVRYEAAYKLADSPSMADFDALVRSLDDSDLRVRMWACRALGRLADCRSVSHLIPLLDDAEINVRSQAVWALGRIGTHSAIEALRAACERESHIYVKSYLHDALSR